MRTARCSCSRVPPSANWRSTPPLRATLRPYRDLAAHPSKEARQDRYKIPGADNIQENVRLFLRRSEKFGDVIAVPQYAPSVYPLIDDYCAILAHVQAYCVEQHMRLVLAYCPDYTQIMRPEPLPSRFGTASRSAAARTALHLSTPPPAFNTMPSIPP